MKYAPNNIILELLTEPEIEKTKEIAVKVISDLLTLHNKNEIELLILQATVKSQVFIASVLDKKYVIKLHHHDDNYAQELLAYFLLNGSSIPSLIFYNAEYRALVLSYEEGDYFRVNVNSVLDIASLVGECHGTAQANIKHSSLLKSLLKNEKNEIIIKRCLPDSIYISSQNKKSILNHLYSKVYGKNHTAVCMGDLKPEHCLYDGQRWVTIDIETFTLGMTELHDLLSLINFTQTYEEYNDILPDIVMAYVDSYTQNYMPINYAELLSLVMQYRNIIDFDKSINTELAR